MKKLDDHHPPLEPERAAAITAAFAKSAFDQRLGLQIEEIRHDYARMRLPYHPSLNQPGGLIHGGATTSVMDSTCALAILSAVPSRPQMIGTINMHLHFLDKAVEQDVIAEARVRRRGGSIVFLEADAHTADGRLVAHGEFSFRVKL